jgi:hypothetical protein
MVREYVPDSGVGNPHEQSFYFDQSRDFGQGEPRQREIIYDPNRPVLEVSKDQDLGIKAFLSRFEERLKKIVFITKRPSFVEPPFFSKPLSKTIGLQVAAGATETIFSKEIQDRQRAVITTIGVSVSDPKLLANQSLKFWFALNDQTNGILPLFEDQTLNPVPPGGLPTSGKTTVIPGTSEEPYSLLQNGLAFQTKGHGKNTILFMMQNNGGVAVNVLAVMSFYQYWLPQSDAYASADLQL